MNVYYTFAILVYIYLQETVLLYTMKSYIHNMHSSIRIVLVLTRDLDRLFCGFTEILAIKLV